jgi:hypothetical protein
MGIKMTKISKSNIISNMVKLNVNDVLFVVDNDGYKEVVFKYVYKGITNEKINIGYIVCEQEEYKKILLNKNMILNYEIYNIENAYRLLLRYVDYDRDKFRDIKTNNNSFIKTDDETFLYYKEILNIENNNILINFGTTHSEEIDNVIVNRKDALVKLNTNNYTLEIYKFKHNVKLIYNNLKSYSDEN